MTQKNGKIKYRQVLDTLRNIKPEDNIKHNTISKVLGGTPTAGALANKYHEDGWIELAKLKPLEKKYGYDFNSNEIIRKDDDCITLEHISIHPSCGKGTDVFYDPEVSPIQIGINLIKQFFKVTHPKNLKTFTASGDSMNPVIEHGDLILVDTGDLDFVNGGIFLLTIDNDWYIKRLRKRMTGELDIISDNSKYPVETLQVDTFREVCIKGRVIKNLSRGL